MDNIKRITCLLASILSIGMLSAQISSFADTENSNACVVYAKDSTVYLDSENLENGKTTEDIVVSVGVGVSGNSGFKFLNFSHSDIVSNSNVNASYVLDGDSYQIEIVNFVDNSIETLSSTGAVILMTSDGQNYTDNNILYNIDVLIPAGASIGDTFEVGFNSDASSRLLADGDSNVYTPSFESGTISLQLANVVGAQNPEYTEATTEVVTTEATTEVVTTEQITTRITTTGTQIVTIDKPTTTTGAQSIVTTTRITTGVEDGSGLVTSRISDTSFVTTLNSDTSDSSDSSNSVGVEQLANKTSNSDTSSSTSSKSNNSSNSSSKSNSTSSTTKSNSNDDSNSNDTTTIESTTANDTGSKGVIGIAFAGITAISLAIATKKKY